MLANIEFYEEKEEKETKPIREESMKQETKTQPKEKNVSDNIKSNKIDVDKYHHLSLKHEVTRYKLSF